MPSYDTIWIPTLVTAHVIGVVFMLYALENLHGLVTGCSRFVKWKLGLYTAEELKQWAAYNQQQQNGADVEPPTRKSNKRRAKEERKKGKEADSDNPEPSELADTDVENLPIPVELTWENVSCTVQPGGASTAKKIIHECSGSFFPCEAIAIMGPSGAGKSTLLDVLAGRTTGKGVGGSVHVNGLPITQKTSNLYISYVGQEDVFMPTLSAWESLSFISQLCMAPIPTAERIQRMEAVLTTMGLSRVKNSKVGGYLPGGVAVKGLSGGEKRRLSIACGLIGNPSILFLDEPTTGLDSFAALAVMKYLNALTDRGHTVISSIHQPRQEIFSTFDKVLILSEGYLLYLAPPAFVVPWFGEVLNFPYTKERDGTVADWLITVIAVGFRKGTDTKARSMSSVEEVKAAALKFAESSQIVKEAEEAANSYLETDDLDSVRDGQMMDMTPPASVTGGGQMPRKPSEASMLSTSIFSGQSSMGGMQLLQAAQGANSDLVRAVQEDNDDISEISIELHAKRYSRSWLFQFWMLWKRSVLHQLRNPAEAGARVLTASWSGIIPGLVWIRLNDNGSSAQERLALLFFAIVMFCMTPFGFMAFPLADKRFFILDSTRGLYSPSAYTAAYICSNTPFFIMNSWASVLVTYGLVGLRYKGWAILQSLGIITLHALVTNQFVTMCIWLASSQDMAFSLATIYISFSLLICGFYIRIRDMTLSVVRGLTWVSFSKYSFQGLAITELKNRVWEDPTCQPLTAEPGFGQTVPLCSYPSNFILSYYDFNLSVPQCCAALLGFWAFFALLSYWALLRLYKRKR